MDILTNPNDTSLNGKRVAILATDGFEESELRSPREALLQAGAFVDLVALKLGAIKGWKDGNWSEAEQVDLAVADANADDYDALVIPGGVMNPDKLRMNKDAIAFVRAFFEQHKPVAAICHGPWVLAEADVLKGRKVTSYKSIKTDLINAGAHWEDLEVVVDHGLVTSRTPKDLPAFNAKLVEEVREGRHKHQEA
jgi:protease I